MRSSPAASYQATVTLIWSKPWRLKTSKETEPPLGTTPTPVVLASAAADVPSPRPPRRPPSKYSSATSSCSGTLGIILESGCVAGRRSFLKPASGRVLASSTLPYPCSTQNRPAHEAMGGSAGEPPAKSALLARSALTSIPETSAWRSAALARAVG